MNTLRLYAVFLHRKDLDIFHTLASNFNDWCNVENILSNTQYVAYSLKMHESELMILKLSIEDISIAIVKI